MDAYCIPCPGAIKQHRRAGYGDVHAEINSLIASVRGAPSDPRLPEATRLDIVKRHAEHRIAVKHGGNERQTMLEVIWAQVHQTAYQKQAKEGVKAADRIRAAEDSGYSAPEATYLLYLSAVGKFNLGELADAKRRALKVLSIDRGYTRAAVLIHLIQNRARKHPLGWLPWHKKA